ncbi:ABC transporter permease [Colwellia psychrerythraea]|uniref:Putative ABC transporter, permease protein n=1 Tax=Colwellia psychrerythraea (strain 34H / ATCC BAA-681) TaxID=167879 RepID=Q489E0_COLP3|nr:ABC transporter permease [Colwellia psychrerythraea]AAZ25050.1 putative ABC transporter, permease protein [Colwellia psychrerythraea 34H]
MRSDSLFVYNLTLAMQSFKRAPTLYFLIILTLSIGVGVLCANLALVNSMASDPIPEKSAHLFHINMNTWPDDQPPDEPMHILRYRDAMAIAESNLTKGSAIFYASGVYARDAESNSMKRFDSDVRATTPGFFELTNAPFAYGAAFEKSRGMEIVIGDELNQKIFAGKNSVGKTLELDGELLTIVGVLKPWVLRPLFYHPTERRAFNLTDDIFAPLETAIDLGWSIHARSSSAVDYTGIEETRDKDVYYLQAWVELENVNQKPALQSYLDNYSQQLKDAGEHPLAIKNELHNVNEWLKVNKVVDQKVLAFTLASVLFLSVCIFNASSLLLSRFHAAKFEVGLRRAIGASNRHMLVQGLTESVLLGLFTGAVALVLSWLFLKLSVQFLPRLANIAVLEPKLLVLGMLLALVTSIASALYPLYRANRYSISAELK